MRPSFLFRKFLIHKNVQFSLMFYFLSNTVIILAAIYFCLSVMITNSFEEFIRITGNNIQLEQLHMQITKIVNFAFFTFGTLGIIITGYSIIIITNRISGPIFRFQKMLQELNENKNVTLRQIRKDDFFQEFYTNLINYIKKNEKR